MPAKNKPFRGGTQTKTNRALSATGFTSLSGFHFYEDGAITKWGGMDKFLNGAQQVFLPATDRFTKAFTHKTATGKRFYAYSINGLTITIRQYSLGLWTSVANFTTANGSVTDLAQATEMNGILFFAVRGVPVKKTNSNPITIFNAGIASPTIGPTSAIAIAGGALLSGTYRFVYTYFSTTFQRESNPSPAGSLTITNPPNSSIQFNITPSTDPQVDRVRIYRTTAGGGVFLFESESTNTVIQSITGAATGIEVELLANGAPPTFEGLATVEGRGYGYKENSSDIFFSSIANLDAWHVNDFRSLPSDIEGVSAGVITGIGELFSLPVVFKTDSIWVGEATDDRLALGFRRQVIGVGCVSAASIVRLEGKNLLVFASDTGIYIFDGSTVEKISSDIDPIWQNLDKAGKKSISAIIYKSKDVVIFSVRDGLLVLFLLIWNYGNKTWATRKMTTAPNALSLISDANNNELVYVGVDGGLAQFDVGTNDLGVFVEGEFISRALPDLEDGMNAGTHKTLISVLITMSGSVGTVEVLIAQDDNTNPYTSIGIVGVPDGGKIGQKYIGCNEHGRRFFLKFRHVTGGNLIVYSIDPQFKIYPGRISDGN